MRILEIIIIRFTLKFKLIYFIIFYIKFRFIRYITLLFFKFNNRKSPTIEKTNHSVKYLKKTLFTFKKRLLRACYLPATAGKKECFIEKEKSRNDVVSGFE